MALLLSIALTLALVLGTAALHYEALEHTGRICRGRPGRLGLLGVVIALLALHVVEIGVFAAGYWCGEHLLGLGRFQGASMTRMDYFYFAAETYTSLGYGDVYPRGNLRLLAGANTLAGLLLLAWSGAFLFNLVEQWRAPSGVRGRG